VKYAPYVKIWLFLKDTILNLAIVQFLIKKKGDTLTMCVSYLRKWRHVLDTRSSHRKQRETHYIGVHLPFT
jgi:hypothetical protein